MSAQPGWYPDGTNHGTLRWWDGQAWTAHLAPAPTPAPAPQAPAAPAPQAPAPGPQPAASVPQPPRRRTGLWIGLGVGAFAVVTGLVILFGVTVATFVDGIDITDRQSLAAQPDTATVRAELDSTYPGPWTVADVYGDGTACAQLCSILHIEFTLPTQTEPYAQADVEAAFAASRAAAEAAGWHEMINICFRNDADIPAGSQAGEAFGEQLAPAILGAGEGHRDPDGDLDYGMGGCVTA